MATLKKQLDGYRLTTAEITYYLPDRPILLQTYLWQEYDLAPRFPVCMNSSLSGKRTRTAPCIRSASLPPNWSRHLNSGISRRTRLFTNLLVY